MDTPHKDRLIDMFTYGMRLKAVDQQGDLKNVILYINDSKPEFLQIQQCLVNHVYSIYIQDIANVYLGTDSGKFGKVKSDLLIGKACLTLHLSKTNTFDLIFKDNAQREDFQLGLKLMKLDLLFREAESPELPCKKTKRSKTNAETVGNI